MRNITPRCCSPRKRKGAVLVLTVVMLPVILILCMLVMNVAHMQLVRTELKIAVDAAALAGSNSYSQSGDLVAARAHAIQAASLNEAGGIPVGLSTQESDGDIVFGDSVRTGDNRYVFTSLTDQQINDGAVATGVRVTANHTSSLLFRLSNLDMFQPEESTVASQLDRDIALVYDRSGSMVFFDGGSPALGEDYLYNTITNLYNGGHGIPYDEYIDAVADYQGDPALAAMPLADREYSSLILSLLPADLLVYAQSLNDLYRTGLDGPVNSQWYRLKLANAAFFDVLRNSSRPDYVSVSSFSGTASIDIPLSTDMVACEATINSMYPNNSTAIGDGMLLGFQTLNGPNARPNAVKTIIVFSDGVNNAGVDPSDAVTTILSQNPDTVIHTVTFGSFADIPLMQSIANTANGEHFHAVDGMQLIDIFRRFASNSASLVTE